MKVWDCCQSLIVFPGDIGVMIRPFLTCFLSYAWRNKLALLSLRCTCWLQDLLLKPLLFSALTFAATPLSNATQKTLPAFVGRPKMLIKKAYHLAIIAPVGKL
jgi:hypothetical protein